MRISWIALSVALVTGSEATAAAVAVLDNVSGQVSIQTSKGVRPVGPGTQLSEGDRLAVGRGSATVSYLNGKCKGNHEIGAQTIVVILNSESQCLKRVEGAKAQGTGLDAEAVLPGVAALAVGGGIAAGLAFGGGGGGGGSNVGLPLLRQISP